MTVFCGACDPAADTEWDGTGQTVCGKDRRSAAGGKLPAGKGRFVRLLDVGGKIRYEEILDRKSGKMVPGLRFSSEDQVALDYRRIQETFGTNFYYAYAKQEDFKRFFKEIELVKRA